MEVIHDQAGLGCVWIADFRLFPVARLFQGSDDALWTQERGAAGAVTSPARWRAPASIAAGFCGVGG